MKFCRKNPQKKKQQSKYHTTVNVWHNILKDDMHYKYIERSNLETFHPRLLSRILNLFVSPQQYVVIRHLLSIRTESKILQQL
jgi:hypothetical protein